MNVIEAVNDADVRHLAHASVAGAERSSGIRRWESKWRIEGRIGALGLPATILRPVRFMENHSDPTMGVRNGVLTDVVKPEMPVQRIAATDMGAFATLAFTNPGRYIGQALEIAGDELTLPQVVDAISRTTGVSITYRAIPREALTGLDPDARAGYDFANHRGGWQADISELRSSTRCSAIDLPERAAPCVATRQDKAAVRHEAKMLVAAIKCMDMTPSCVSLPTCSRCPGRQRRPDLLSTVVIGQLPGSSTREAPAVVVVEVLTVESLDTGRSVFA